MNEWINKRKAEVTTYVGVSSIIYGLMTLFKADGAIQIQRAINTQAENFASGNWGEGLAMLGIGVIGLFAREQD